MFSNYTYEAGGCVRRKHSTYSERTAEEGKECLRTNKTMAYNMSVAEQLAELAGLAVEKMMIIINKTSTNTEESVAPQNSTMSGEEAVRKQQTSKKVLISFDRNVRYQ